MAEAKAKCPKCNQWSPVYWFSALPPGGYWWKTAGCPKCGAIVLVETECDIVEPNPLEQDPPAEDEEKNR
jgi:hypothetical protein